MTYRSNNATPLTSRRYAVAVAILASTMIASPVSAFHLTSPVPLCHSRMSSQSKSQTRLFSATAEPTETKYRPNPVVVSAKAEALSHSETTMKLSPSFELFQMLDEEEGGEIPAITSGNVLRDPTILKHGTPPDSLDGFKLEEYCVTPSNKSHKKKRIEDLPDPFKLVEQELQPFSDSIKELVSSDQPILSMAAKHFFEKRHGKRFRPTIVQLVAKAVAASRPEVVFHHKASVAVVNGVVPVAETTTPSLAVEGEEIQNGVEQATSSTTGKAGGVSGWQWSGASTIEVEGGVINALNHKGSEVWRRQAQLGQIVEMIHVASLIHDDVLDEADTRRGGESVHKLYSNKVAVLAGDYLLARASVLLARLENTAVVQIMATALESLVAGEIMQLKSPPASLLEMESYLRKSYYKTASLICYACRSTALLGGHAYGSNVATACEEFGFHLGLAYQIQDDILDFTAAATVLGKPALADMDLGLSTAPILYAAQEMPFLRPLVMRRFKNKGDKQIALEALYKSETAMDKAKNLALFHAQVCW
jgi:geranylgeranyl pyrophosphate synthase